MFKNKIFFSKLREGAVIPSKKDEDAGYDLYACFDDDYILLDEGQTKLIPLGIAWAADKKYYMQFHERSSCGSKGIKVNAGVIDSGYRGEFKVAIFNATGKKLIFTFLSEDDFKQKFPSIYKKEPLVYCCKKAIAQGVIHKVHKMKTFEIPYDQLCQISSERKSGGFGSTNKKDG